jgi:hypothetical protein
MHSRFFCGSLFSSFTPQNTDSVGNHSPEITRHVFTDICNVAIYGGHDARPPYNPRSRRIDKTRA